MYKKAISYLYPETKVQNAMWPEESDWSIDLKKASTIQKQNYKMPCDWKNLIGNLIYKITLKTKLQDDVTETIWLVGLPPRAKIT